MSPLAAWREGVRRVGDAPVVLAGMWIATVLAALPLALAIRAAIEQHLGASLAADTLVSGVNFDWMQEFGLQARGAAATVNPTIIGFGAVLDNLSAMADATARPIAIVAAAACAAALWLFTSGGIIDRYARGRPIHANGFFSASGVFFLRFLRLAVVMILVYGLLFGPVHQWLFGTAFTRLTRDVTVDRTAFLIRAALYLTFAAAVGACNLVFDYAKVRAVVEDRRSMIGAIAAALRFAARNRGAAAGLYLLNVASFVVVLALYAIVAPGAAGRGAAMWIAFAIGQLYIAARIGVKLTFWASATALFQSRLAHAGYVAAPEARWPESPAAEAI